MLPDGYKFAVSNARANLQAADHRRTNAEREWREARDALAVAVGHCYDHAIKHVSLEEGAPAEIGCKVDALRRLYAEDLWPQDIMDALERREQTALEAFQNITERDDETAEQIAWQAVERARAETHDVRRAMMYIRETALRRLEEVRSKPQETPRESEGEAPAWMYANGAPQNAIHLVRAGDEKPKAQAVCGVWPPEWLSEGWDFTPCAGRPRAPCMCIRCFRIWEKSQS